MKKERKPTIESGAYLGDTGDADKMKRLTRNVTELLVNVLRAIEDLANTSQKLRSRISVDLNALAKTTPAEKHEQLRAQMVAEIKKQFQDPSVIASLGEKLAAKALSKHTIEVTGDDKCLGQSGGSVTVTANGIIAGACVSGSPGNITGGGVSGGFTY